MFKKVTGMGLIGLNAFTVTAEVEIELGMPKFDIVGLADASVQESQTRIRSALKNSGVSLEPQAVTVNLTPASVKKSGSLFDLTIMAGILIGNGLAGANEPNPDKTVFMGEISLGGSLNPVNGALPIAVTARERGFTELYLPEGNALEASVVEGLEVYGVRDIAQLVAHLTGRKRMKPQPPYRPKTDTLMRFADFAEVRGQENVKLALEVAAAGFHNILMIGTPGTGKSMLAKRLPSILPPMCFRESLETTQVHSVSGLLDSRSPLVVARPFRAVSHTASAVGIVGGGAIPRPGEISLAHNGVLFLDELPEFDRRALETLRQPLEDGEIHITRTAGKVCYPCNVMLVAAMNPCPCGNSGHPDKACTCTELQITRYLGKISQPVLDRIDIQVEVAPITYDEISTGEKGEPSERVRARVAAARELQGERFRGTDVLTNSAIPAGKLHEYCQTTPDGEEFLRGAFDRLGMSARAYERVLKVARTCADLDGERLIGKKHVARAVQYRSLDKKYWKNR